MDVLKRLDTNDPFQLFEAIRNLRLFSGAHQDEYGTILNANGLIQLTHCLEMKEYPEIQYEALWCLTNLSLFFYKSLFLFYVILFCISFLAFAVNGEDMKRILSSECIDRVFQLTQSNNITLSYHVYLSFLLLLLTFTHFLLIFLFFFLLFFISFSALSARPTGCCGMLCRMM